MRKRCAFLLGNKVVNLILLLYWQVYNEMDMLKARLELLSKTNMVGTVCGHHVDVV